MAKYEALPTTAILPNGTMLHANKLPELVHLEDPALSVMIDFTLTPPHTIHPNDTMDRAIHEMQVSGTHLLLVVDEAGHFKGIVTSQDVLGEKPITLLQESRMHRDQITVKMIMVPYTHILALDFALVESIACVGHIVKTLATHKQHYALAVLPDSNNIVQHIRGIFIASQLSKQLHIDAADLFTSSLP